jgi:hypothetical protein
MGMIECINDFVDTMVSEKSQFENMQNEVSKREDDVSEILDILEKNEIKIISALKSRINERKDENMKLIFTQTSQSMFDTISAANSRIKEAVKGMTFIQDFEKQFTVSVFGKVKAGKSYIGNFIMGQPIKKAGIKTSYDSIDDLTVHVYDRGKMFEQKKLSTLDEEKECNGEEFYVNKSEATSTIQWVNIGGMCWFDTPGIGSVTLENEELAKEYVKNSDLVIFACNSDAAGTRQEFTEIKQLHDMKKPILLLLTQSDTYDFDVDDDGNEISILIPKSERDRADQEQYMLDTLREQCMEDVLKYADILTVSALLATEAIKSNDEAMFEQSNMGKLLEKLTQITQNDAAEMKHNTPKNRINEMIESIITDLNKMSKMISDTCASIEDSKRALIERKDGMIGDIRASVNMEILKIIAEAKAEVERNSSVISEEKLSADINDAISTIVQKVCMQEVITNTEKIPDLNIQLTGIGDMKMRQDRIPYEYASVIKVSRPPKGLLEKAGKIFFKKEYYTSESRTETRYSTFDIGVNDTDIANNIVLQLDTVFSSTIDNYVTYLTEGYYEPVEILERKTTAEIANAINQLEEMRM